MVGLPVVPYNQNKHADVIKYLEWFNAYVVADFMDWTGMMEIQSLLTKVSTPPDVRRNQQEKIQYPTKVIGSFVDSFCLALPNVKNAIEKQREQQQQACVQNNNIGFEQSNNILPGIIYLLLDARVDYLSQIYLFNLSVVLGLKTESVNISKK